MNPEKRKKKQPHKAVNGVKGAITLFLAILMTPFLTIAMSLVEAGRYNSAVSLMDEAMGVAAVSTLADKDDYLKDRWGLFSLGQEHDLGTTFTRSLEENAGALGKSVTINTTKAEGLYPLSDAEVLYNQVMEFSKMSAPLKLAENFLDLADLVKKFEKLLSIGNIAELLNSGVDALDSMITIAETAEKLKKLADDISKNEEEYNTKYDAFEKAANDLIDAQKQDSAGSDDDNSTSESPAPTESAAPAANLDQLKKDAKKARDEYKDAVGELADNLDSFKTQMEDWQEAVESLFDDALQAVSSTYAIRADLGSKKTELDKVDKQIKKLKEEGVTEDDPRIKKLMDQRSDLEVAVAELQVKQAAADASNDGVQGMTESWRTSFQNYNNENTAEIVRQLNRLKEKLVNLKIDTLTGDSPKITQQDYKVNILGSYVKSSDIDAFLEAQKEEMNSGSLKDLLALFNSLFNSLFKTALLYDPALCAVLDTGFYNQKFGGLPGQDMSAGGISYIIRSISDFFGSISDFLDNLKSGKWMDNLKKLKEIIQSGSKLFEAIQNFVTGLIETFQKIGQKLCYTTYSAFNLPCRTDCTGGALSFETLTGYSMTGVTLPRMAASANYSFFDDIAAMVDTVFNMANNTGNSYAFCGAELEYMLFGSRSEIANQLYTFLSLYLIRLVLDLAPVLSNAETQAMAGVSGLGYPVVMIILCLLEPLADALLLVNGAKVSLVKTKVFLTPSGVLTLVEKLLPLMKARTEEDKQNLKKDLLGVMDVTSDSYDEKLKGITNGVTPEEHDGYGWGLLELDYREYIFLMLLLTTSKEEQLQRLANLIQTETYYHYSRENAPFEFDLRKTYTFLSTEANLTVNQMLPALLDSGFFTIQRQCYRGY